MFGPTINKINGCGSETGSLYATKRALHQTAIKILLTMEYLHTACNIPTYLLSNGNLSPSILKIMPEVHTADSS